MPIPSVLFKTLSFAGTAAILAAPDDQQLGIWAVFAVSLAGVITTYINRRADRLEAAQRHKWDKDDREEKAADAKKAIEDSTRAVVEKADQLQRSVDVNTSLTSEAVTKAERAYDAANHVNEKFVALAGAPLVPLAQDTNETVHRIEDQARPSDH